MMRIMTQTILALLLLTTTAFTADPLPSWNDTAAKKTIVSFVEQVTRKGSPDFVPPAERIAVFDVDGTLLPEQPIYFPLAFNFDQIKLLAPQHPEWQDKEPFKAILEGDLQTALAADVSSWLEIDVALHAGRTTEEFEKSVKDWAATAKHPITGQLYTDMTYQPMLELLDYLRDNGFKTFLVSGGWFEFMRPWTEGVFGVPPEQVIGSSFKTSYELRDGEPVFVYLPEVQFRIFGTGKPIGINQQIGRRPIAAFGNADGDLPMLQWTSDGSGARLAMLVHHTDAEREWAYDRAAICGRLDKALDEAQARDWTIVDMKKDWKIIYPFEKK